MALNKLKFNSLNVTPTAGKVVGFNSDADGLEATLSGGAMTFIKKLTASSSATLSFVDGSSGVVLDDTYKEYVFIFKDIHAQTDNIYFQFNFSVDSGSNYNVTKTSTVFSSYHNESGNSTDLSYRSGSNGGLAQSTAFQNITTPDNMSSDNDHILSGTFTVFNPSSTTFVKHYMSHCSFNNVSDHTINAFMAGYGNTTSAVDAVQFKMSSGNIDSGTITLYGIN